MAEHFILFSVILLSLAFSVSCQVFWSVNCGASDSYVDGNSISWTPDGTLVSNGVARVVQSSKSMSTVLDTLRVFTTRKKNCYSTPVTQGEKLLVRASFYYGNYDLLSSPPTFALHFDGNFWITVETSNSGISMYEATYAAKGDSVSVCVAQTKPGQFPFMTSLEVRSVASNVYNVLDEDRALFLISRFSYGASGTLRFPQDRYDRIWLPASAGIWKVTNDALYVDPTGPNNPPSGIFDDAIMPPSTADTLGLLTVYPNRLPVYLTWYFTEVSNLAGTGLTRSFRFYATSTTQSGSISLPISPPYGTMIERELYNYTVVSNTSISLFATFASDLPPLLNAYEVFWVSDVLTDGTDSNDVAALALLQTTFDVLAEWSGDPCLPAPYSWDWLDCSNDTPPRVTSLLLDGYRLSGTLPDISSMDALEMIDMHNNSLTGGIPGFLGTMPKLQQLNLADNDLSGSIPASLSNNKKLKLTLTGNPSLCTSGNSCSSSPGTTNSSPGNSNSSPGNANSSPGSTKSVRTKKKKSKLPLILGIALPAFILMWVAVGLFVIFNKKKQPVNANVPVVNANVPVATGHTAGGAHVNSGGGPNGNSQGLRNIGVEMTNDAVQQTDRSPSPLLDNSGRTNATRVQNHGQP